MVRNNVIAVVVTYNRLPLLQEAIEALTLQTQPLAEIVVVNNSSTDGTTEWLAKQNGLTVINQPNSGGSGGFYTGLKHAVNAGADWVWLMDDDTICTITALDRLTEKIALLGADKIGFLSSKVVWKDGTPHNMNLPDLKTFHNEIPFNLYDQEHVLLSQGCSFVSALVSAAVVKKVGLPYKDFYIWGDDQEYTKRITTAGFTGAYVGDSLVLHKTPGNHRAYIYTDTPQSLWKHAYGFRNEFFMVRRDKGFLYYLLYMIARIIVGSYKIIKIRKKNRLQFIAVLFRSAYKSLFFYPTIDHV